MLLFLWTNHENIISISMIHMQCTMWWFMHTWHMGIWVAYGGFKRLRYFLDQINIDCLDTHIVSQIADSHRGDSSSLHVRRQYFLYQRLLYFERPSIRNNCKMVIPIVSFAWFLDDSQHWNFKKRVESNELCMTYVW